MSIQLEHWLGFLDGRKNDQQGRFKDTTKIAPEVRILGFPYTGLFSDCLSTCLEIVIRMGGLLARLSMSCSAILGARWCSMSAYRHPRAFSATRRAFADTPGMSTNRPTHAKFFFFRRPIDDNGSKNKEARSSARFGYQEEQSSDTSQGICDFRRRLTSETKRSREVDHQITDKP